MESKGLPITGTFLDEISLDIPSQNWGPDEWRADFDAMRAIGIDTVVIIRGGLRDRAIFPSEVIGTDVQEDLGTLFLELARERKMRLFFGTYDSWDWARNGTWKEEIAINRRFMDEVWNRYGSYSSFTGWYLSHETSHSRFHFPEVYRELSEEAKKLTPNKPVLISPFYPSRKVYGDEGMEPERFADDCRKMLEGVKTIDCAAFQDGTAGLDELDRYLAQAKQVMDELGIELWNNVETFSRTSPSELPPIGFDE
ncbi:MAG: DUF4434 domain-containing protein, partial [Bacteroidota bacterium]